MITTTIDFRVTGYNGWKTAYPDFKRELLLSLEPFSRMLERQVMNSIRANRPPPQSPVWALAPEKLGKGTLMNTGLFLHAVEGRVRSGRGNLIAYAEAGHFKDQAHGGTTMSKLASIMLEGTAWEPTPAQRKAFWSRVGTRPAEGVIPKKIWVIPPRDYLSPVMRNTRIRHALDMAIYAALRRVFKKGQR